MLKVVAACCDAWKLNLLAAEVPDTWRLWLWGVCPLISGTTGFWSEVINKAGFCFSVDHFAVAMRRKGVSEP